MLRLVYRACVRHSRGCRLASSTPASARHRLAHGVQFRLGVLAAAGTVAVGLLARSRLVSEEEPPSAPLEEVEPQPEPEKVESVFDGGEADDWQRVIAASVPAIVALHVNTVRPFDTEKPGSSQATGFVVDKKRGLILTNKHVTHDGPVIAEAVFNNHEEVPVRAVYRDPVHDFGFFQFDPKDVRYMELQELELKPERARVGTDVRVIGNNAGEKLSILTGTLARLDRHAPDTGIGADFNTFYIQAASSTSGGSSGSPVIDKTGSVVALNAAGKMMTAVSYYLPLDRVKRALDLIREGKPVPRGDLQTVFRHVTFGEAARLGLSAEDEAILRSTIPTATGLLVVQETIPQGVAQGVLEAGDVLLRVNGTPVTHFTELEAIFDDSVDKLVNLEVVRNKQRMAFQIKVQNLREVTPSSFFEAGGCVFNDLSYHYARAYGVPVGGVFVARSGYMLQRVGVPAGTVITKVKGQPTPNVEEFQRVLSTLKNGELVPVRLYNIARPGQEATAVVRMDRQWFPMLRAWRDDEKGEWPIEFCDTNTEDAVPPPSRTNFPSGSNPIETKISPSLASVRFTMPFVVDGLNSSGSYLGLGLVVDAKNGLVMCDRNTVPSALGDISLTFASSVEIPAKALFIHPVHNVAVLQYDPALLLDTPVQAAQLAPSKPKAGDAAWLVGISGSRRTGFFMTSSKAKIGLEQQTSAVSALIQNMDALTLQGSSLSGHSDGVVLDEEGLVLALWASFGPKGAPFLGVPADVLAEVLQPLKEGKMPQLSSLGVRLEYLSLSDLRHMGLDDQTAMVIENTSEQRGGRRQAVVVAQRWHNTQAYSVLQDGDVVLAIDGSVVATCKDVTTAVKDKPEVEVEVLREGERKKLKVQTLNPSEGSPVGTDRVLLWAGAVLQTPPLLAQWLMGAPKDSVFVAMAFRGSPAQRYHLDRSLLIFEVDGQPTPNLDAFLAAVAHKKDGDVVHMKHINIRDKKVGVTTLKVNNQFFPTQLLEHTEDGWKRKTLTTDAAQD
eukprot:m.93183 g.93183  ORF g.93183 m.93183 type:complete len:1008 (-) comp18306_c0_seq4:53-3076(-)